MTHTPRTGYTYQVDEDGNIAEIRRVTEASAIGAELFGPERDAAIRRAQADDVTKAKHDMAFARMMAAKHGEPIPGPLGGDSGRPAFLPAVEQGEVEARRAADLAAFEERKRAALARLRKVGPGVQLATSAEARADALLRKLLKDS
jgi:hypothetical protein